LTRSVDLGIYGQRFGSPHLRVEVKQERIHRIEVDRGAPCAATWQAAERLVGSMIEGAAIRYGLETQYFCSADPSGWDPVNGKSPVHFAGHMHAQALSKALKAI
jgi:hypothetical protein